VDWKIGVRLSPHHEEEHVMERQQEHSSENTPSDTKYNPSTPSLRDSASLHREKALSGEYHTRVAELAYALYEQRARKDGQDQEDWFNAEQRIMTDEGSGRSM